MKAALATRIAPPVLRAELVPRAALLNQLNTARRVTLLAAAAGYGKTTTVAAWAATLPHAAWLTLDSGDNDPAQLWRYLLSAIERAAPGLASAALAALETDPSASTDAVPTALLNALSSAPLTLILDDCQLLTTSAAIQVLTLLADRLPPGVRLVLISRVAVPLPLARLRARGELTEVAAGALRFTDAEAAALLRTVLDPPLASAAVAALNARVDGWPTGLHLAALALQGQDDRERMIADLRGSDRFILDYLMDEVLAQQPADIQQFVLATALLDRLSAPLCAALLEPLTASAAQTLLERVESQGLFLTALDRERRWFRYERIFAEALRARLAYADPAQTRQLHQRAAAWFSAAALPAEAVPHLLAAGDLRGAAALIEDVGQRMLRQSEIVRLQGWLAALPRPLVLASSRLCLHHAWVSATTHQLDAAAPWLAAAAAAPDGPEVATEIAAVALLIAALRGEPINVEQRLQPLAAQLSPALASIVTWAVAFSCFMRGELDAAAPLFDEAIVYAAQTADPDATIRALTGLGQLQARRGYLDAAADYYRRALALASTTDTTQMPVACMTLVGMAEVAAHHGQWSDAAGYARRATLLAERWGNPHIVMQSWAVLALTQAASGDASGAGASLDRADRAAARGALPWALQRLAVTRAAVLEQLAAPAERSTAQPAAAAVPAEGLPEPLSEREREVLALLAAGLSNQAIASTLVVSLATVKTHLINIYGKLQVHSRTQAVARARAIQLVT